MTTTVSLNTFIFDGAPRDLTLDEVDVNFFGPFSYAFGDLTPPYLFGVPENELVAVSQQDAFSLTLTRPQLPDGTFPAVTAAIVATGLPAPLTLEEALDLEIANDWLRDAADARITTLFITSNISDRGYAITINFDGNGPTPRELVEDWTEADLRALDPIVNGVPLGGPGGPVEPEPSDDWTGTNGPDTRVGTDADQSLNGLGGDDSISGRGGGDTILGGAGDDTLEGDAGNDLLQGDAGNDRLLGGAGFDTLEGGVGIDLLLGGAGNDDLRGDGGQDTLEGGAGDDGLNGGEGRDTLRGDAGDDTLDGGAGDDWIFGGAGNDVITDTAGRNIFIDEAGTDTYAGGAERDVFVFDGQFSGGRDEIAFRGASDSEIGDLLVFRRFEGLSPDDDDLLGLAKFREMKKAGFAFDVSATDVTVETGAGTVHFDFTIDDPIRYLDQIIFL